MCSTSAQKLLFGLLHFKFFFVCRFTGEEGHTWHSVALKLTALNAFVTDTRRGINGLVSMRWVFLGAVDVPAHAKSRITEEKTEAPRSDGRTVASSHSWRWWQMEKLPAKCTHIFNSITLSQHRSSHCQSRFAHLCRIQSANNCRERPGTWLFLL